MPAEFWTEARQMAEAGAIVAAVALPAGLACRLAARRPLLPPVKPWRVPWTGVELFGTFVLVAVLIPMLFARAGVDPLAVGLAALPAQLAFLVVAARVLYPAWNPFRDPQPLRPDDLAYVPDAPRAGPNYAGLFAVAVAAWAVLTPLVLLFHAGVLQVFTALDLTPDEHPLTQFRDGDSSARVLFLLQACVAAPLVEEILFRGVLLPWVVGASERPKAAAPVLVAPEYRPWVVMAVAGLFAATTGKPGPAVFAGVLAAGLVVVWVVRRGKRHVRAVYATAAFFALVHSGVWPSPIPLFVLALGLGFLAVRTRGVFAPFVVHGLFNAVSAVYVLRAPA